MENITLDITLEKQTDLMLCTAKSSGALMNYVYFFRLQGR